MGSKNCPETPRQKMISMMYLVLTAMLALNVSKDILQAFTVVNDSIVATNNIFEGKANFYYDQFEKSKLLQPEKVKENYGKAQQVKKEAAALKAYINTVKYEIVAAVEKLTTEEVKAMEADKTKSFLAQVNGKDNFDIPHNYFFGESEDGSNGCKVAELKQKIVDFKKKMTDLLGPKLMVGVALGLDVEKEYPNLEGDGTNNWQITNFAHTILAADVTMLNKLILEVSNAEAGVVQKLYESIGAEGFSFDKVEAKVIAKSNYVLTGDKYEAEIFVAAYDSKQQPKIYVGSGVDSVNMTVIGAAETIEGENGVGKLERAASSLGEQKYGGIVEVISRSGVTSKYPFSASYFVAQPSATVSADKMNVFYIGVENPVTISVPGVPNDQVRASISNGSLSPTGNGHYIVKVTGGAEANITVTAQTSGGTKGMGQTRFRVKPLPTPIPKLAGKISGNFTKAEILAQPHILAVLENFDFELRYNVVSFVFTYRNAAGDLLDIQGGGMMLNAQMQDKIRTAKRGDRFMINDIKAAGPTGTKAIGSLNIKITQ